MKRFFLSVLIIVFCIPHPLFASSYKDAFITLERTMCFGTCPVYTLTIYGDGRVEYEGKKFVKVTDMQKTTIPQDKVNQLIDEFEKAGYFSMKDSYESYEITDLPYAITSLTLNGKAKRIKHYYGDSSAPKALSDLESKIDNAVNSEQWIKGVDAPKQDKKLALEEQEKLAKELYGIMAKTDEWDTETFIKLHRQVIEQCPDTKQAQESLWRLSNLYLLTKDPPDYPKIIELMEELISKYPGSLFCPDAKNRLLIAYEQTGNYKKAVALYEDMFARDPGLVGRDEYAAVLLGYAKALAKSGDKEKARKTYQKVIDLKNAEDWLKDIARNALSGTEKSESGEKK